MFWNPVTFIAGIRGIIFSLSSLLLLINFYFGGWHDSIAFAPLPPFIVFLAGLRLLSFILPDIVSQLVVLIFDVACNSHYKRASIIVILLYLWSSLFFLSILPILDFTATFTLRSLILLLFFIVIWVKPALLHQEHIPCCFASSYHRVIISDAQLEIASLLLLLLFW